MKGTSHTRLQDHLTESIKRNVFLCDAQYGFVQGRSMTLHLLMVINEEKGEVVDTCYLDFMKASDSDINFKVYIMET